MQHGHPSRVLIVVTDGCAGVIGLLLIKKGAGAGAYEHYHLGSGRATYGYQVNDAYAVHDQMLWLPIGLAHAK